MEAPVEAHDLEPAIRSLASLLPCGVLLLSGEGTPCFASARAADLLGTAEPARLADRWQALCVAAGISRRMLPTGAQPLRTHGTIDGGDGPRAVRIEAHATGSSAGARWLVLMKRRDRADDHDTALIAASRADTSQQVLAGLLHDLNGPLNNLSLTLALLSGTLSRVTAQQPDDATLARCRRYVDTLTAETQRFSDSARALGAAIVPPEASTGSIALSSLLQHAQRALRHHASLREVHLSIASAAADLAVAGDPDLLKLALVDLLVTAIDATAPGGEIAVTPDDAGGTLRVRIVARAARIALDRALDEMLSMPRSQSVCFVAARRILELHGGSATLRADSGDAIVIDARMPRAHA
jgi:signal transduction histidine kinase